MSNGEDLSADLEDLVGRVLDGRYVLEKFIDRGGYGAVYRGTDRKFSQPVAVKVGLSSREFMKEARLAAEVKHNHIVHVIDYGSDQGLAFLVMEFLQGDNLEKLFTKQGKRLSLDQLRKLVNEVGDALAYAHADQLIHRDLKPRNIILREPPNKVGATSAQSKFVLLDFGIAAKLDAEGTQRNRTQDGAGTVEYMAPELLVREPKATVQSDVYSFGIILYQMMTGRVPFPQTDNSHMALAACLNSIAKAPPPRFRQLAPDRDYPPQLEELVLKCLEKDPAQRVQSISQVRTRFLEISDRITNTSLIPNRMARSADLSETIRPEDLINSQQYQELPLGDSFLVPAIQTGATHIDLTETIRPEQFNLTTAQAGASSTIPLAKTTHDPAIPKPGRQRQVLLAMIAIVLSLAGYFVYRGMAAHHDPIEWLITNDQGAAIEDSEEIHLTAGNSLTIVVSANGLPRDAVAEFEQPIVPEFVTVQLAKGAMPKTSRNYVITVSDPDAQADKPLPIPISVSVPGQSTSFTRTILLAIDRPKIWLPDDLAKLGFHESPDSRRCLVGRTVYASVLERQIHDWSIRFRLIPACQYGDRNLPTCYVMEHLVSNSQFQQFVKEVPDFELEKRPEDQRSWQASELIDSPVTDIYALEALQCAWWIAGKTFGSLPSTREWEVAAGYAEFIRQLEIQFQSIQNVDANFLKNFRGMQVTIPALDAQAWIGLGPAWGQFQEPRGQLLKERSPYGIEFNRLKDGHRPTEITRDYTDAFAESGDLRSLCKVELPKRDAPVFSKNPQVHLRGAGPEKADILWVKDQQDRLIKSVSDLEKDAETISLGSDGIGRVTFAGFRVVIETTE